MKKNRIVITILTSVAVLLLSSCVHTIDVSACVEGTHQYGFIGGLWHGTIAPFALIGHLFNHDVTIFATNNNGGWYYFGFLLAVGGIGGGLGRSKKRK